MLDLVLSCSAKRERKSAREGTKGTTVKERKEKKRNGASVQVCMRVYL